VSVTIEHGPRVDEQNADLVNVELIDSHWSWNAELPRLAFEVERWPWLRSVFEEATRVSRLMISVTFTLMQYQVALRVEMLPLHWFEVRVWGFVIAPDGHSVNLYWVLILTDRPTTEALLKDGSTPDSHFNSVYRVLTLTTQTYTESLLNDGSTLDGHFYNLYQVLTW